jgi:hypothetical protein
MGGHFPKRTKRKLRSKNLCMIANAMLAGMRVEKHETLSRKWAGPSHTAYSCTIEGVVIYRMSVAALARVYLALLPDDFEGPNK